MVFWENGKKRSSPSLPEPKRGGGGCRGEGSWVFSGIFPSPRSFFVSRGERSSGAMGAKGWWAVGLAQGEGSAQEPPPGGAYSDGFLFKGPLRVVLGGGESLRPRPFVEPQRMLAGSGEINKKNNPFEKKQEDKEDDSAVPKEGGLRQAKIEAGGPRGKKWAVDRGALSHRTQDVIATRPVPGGGGGGTWRHIHHGKLRRGPKS